MQSEGKTIFLTTHFMEEAERLCDRVAIVDHGKIIAMDTPQNLITSLGDESRVVLEIDKPFDHSLIDTLNGVTRVEKIAERILVYGKKEGLINKVVSALETAGVPFKNVRVEQPTLEDVFLKLTGKEIRD
jgi:ABC-2 type transport system ATP-binding protein